MAKMKIEGIQHKQRKLRGHDTSGNFSVRLWLEILYKGMLFYWSRLGE